MKLGAYSLAGVAAFAVAVALMLSVSSTPTAEAAIHERANDGTFSAASDQAAAGRVNNGDVVYIQNAAPGFVLYEITAIGNADASFTHATAQNNGQLLYCSPVSTTATAPTCDVDIPGGGTTVAVKVADDSGKGGIIVKQTVLATGITTADELTVSVKPVPTRLTASASPKAVNAGEGTVAAGTSTLTFRLTDQNGNGIGTQGLTIIASHGTLTQLDAAPGAWTNLDVSGGLVFTGTGTQVGTVTTSTDGGGNADVNGAGYAAVTFEAGGVSGTATITARVSGGTLSNTVDVTMFGAAKTITAEAEQSALQVGGSTFIVVTVTDAGGNAVASHNVAVKSGASGVVGPSPGSREVVTSNQVDKDVAPVGGASAGKGDIPACGDPTAPDPDRNRADPDDSSVDWWDGDGTNTDGKCVIQVTTTGGDTPSTADDTARGTHTITIAGPKADGSTDVKVEIEIGGAPATITSDAPGQLEPGEEVTINVTVVDDEGVRVGAVAIEALKTDGGGLITTPIRAMTSDGRAKFAYLAPSRAGSVDLLVRTKTAKGAETARLPITIQIGEVEPPAQPVSVSGESGLVIVKNADSIGDILGALMCGSTTGTTITLPGNNIYAVGAPAVVNAGFLAGVSFPIAEAPAYVSCGG